MKNTKLETANKYGVLSTKELEIKSFDLIGERTQLENKEDEIHVKISKIDDEIHGIDVELDSRKGKHINTMKFNELFDANTINKQLEEEQKLMTQRASLVREKLKIEDKDRKINAKIRDIDKALYNIRDTLYVTE